MTTPTKPLYVLISDGGDGSYYTNYTLDPELISKLQDASDSGRMWYDNGIGWDGDGFHYDTISVPFDATPESLGISVLDDDYADQFRNEEEDDNELEQERKED